MPPRITDSQRKAVLALLAQALAREMVAAQVGITPGQVSAVAAHMKMGTYEKHGTHATATNLRNPRDANACTHCSKKLVSPAVRCKLH